MGCCVSSTNPKSAARNAGTTNHTHKSAAKDNRSPPLPPPCNPEPEEEESVKEVLSETPSVPKRPSAFSKARQENGDPKWIRPVLPTIAKDIQNGRQQQQKRAVAVAVSGFSSMEDFPEEDASAHSGSVSTAATDKSEFDGQRSFQHKSFESRAAVGRSPARRVDQSPSRGRGGSGSGVRANGARRDPAESSSRRSMSPAKAGSSMGMTRNGSTRKNTKSPGRVKPDGNRKILKLEEFPDGGGRRNRPPTASGDESLENPLVSLECFIFL